MKIHLFLFLTCLILASCGSKTSENTSADSVATEKPEQANSSPTPSGDKDNILTIHGKDIWVRDEPRTGKVIMKLNEGDQCKVIDGEPWIWIDIIRGQADRWLKIEFEGKTGWVFGSQTSEKNKENPREFLNLEDVVKEFVIDTEQLPDSVERFGDNYKVVGKGVFKENGFALVSFHYIQPGMKGENFSWGGFQENGLWKMVELRGEVIKLIHKNDKLLALMFIEITGGAFTGSDDYVLYTIDTINKNFIRQQIVFEYLPDQNNYPSGEAIINLLDETGDQIEISLLRDRYTEKKEVISVSTYQFDTVSMTYKKSN